MRIGCGAIAAAVCLQGSIAAAQSRTLTLAEVLSRAREGSPGIVSARLTLEETRGRLVGASRRFQNNPEIEAGLGARRNPSDGFVELELGIGQTFEPGSRRAARVAGAEAAIAQGAAGVDEAMRSVLRQAAAAFYRTLHAGERIRLLDATGALAADAYSIAERRFKAGDIAVLDVNIARASLARVRAERESAEAVRSLAVGDLKQLLALEDDIGVVGTLAPGTEADLAAALQAAAQRPELRGLEAALAEAEADVRLGGAFTRSEYGVGVRYAREADDQIVLGGLTVRLPVFSKGEELRAIGSARAARLRAELDAARLRIQLEVRAAFDAHRRRLAAVRLLESGAMPDLDANDALMSRSFEVGQLGLPELLLIRREILETRSRHLDALLEAALARIDLDASAAILR